MWDFIIIGAGSSGCAAAYQIINSAPEKSILVIEAGGSDRSPIIQVPAGQIKAITSYDWGYRNEPDDTRHGKVDRWWRGRVVGGSSSVNGTMYVRGGKHDYDRWNDGLRGWNGPGWSAEEVMPIFQEIEASDQPEDVRGHSGSLKVRTVSHPHALSQAFVAGAEATGHARRKDYNGGNQEGVSYAQLTQTGRLRCSAARAFLHPVLKRPNVKLLTNAQVTSILSDGRTASGVSLIRNGQSETYNGRHVILSAGAINSPQLLMLSGIGDPDELTANGIGVKLALPGVGANLCEHPLASFTYKTRIPSFNLTEGIGQIAGFGLQYLRGREGPIANPFEATAFLKSRPDMKNVDLQLHFSPVGYYIGDTGEYVLHDFPSATVLLDVSHPYSRGRIRLRSNNPTDRVRIDYRMFDDERDLETMIDGVLRVREIMASAPMRKVISEEAAPGARVSGREQIADHLRRSASIAYHPAGTCRMGIDGQAVVSPDLRVRGMENLWVADASIMPDLISGNTNAACIMIGAKLGKRLARL